MELVLWSLSLGILPLRSLAEVLPEFCLSDQVSSDIAAQEEQMIGTILMPHQSLHAADASQSATASGLRGDDGPVAARLAICELPVRMCASFAL